MLTGTRILKDQQALARRISGASYQQIADQLDFKDRASAYKAVRRALADETAPADVAFLRAIEVHRLDAVLAAIWPKIIGSPATADSPAVEPDLDAVNVFLRIHHARVKLLHLDWDEEADMEEELRELARQEGLDEEDVLREAEGIIIRNRDRWRRRDRRRR